MLALLAIAFIVVPLIEIYVIIQVGDAIGVLNTIALLVLISVGGAWLAKHEGFWTLTRLREQVDAGRMPTNELIDAGLILAGGILLLTPGFVTDVVGVLVLLPPTRAVIRTFVRRRFRVQVLGPGFGPPGARAPGPGPDARREPPDDVIDV
jgi:UPF0716 protein FxsA